MQINVVNSSLCGVKSPLFSMYFWLLCVFDVMLAAARTMDMDVCVTRFDVHRDKIIRTEDSRAMGARYLDEAELPTREECLRLCCDTDKCDVFVYEEKSPGSCYLFHCGPSEDFRCKFTRHANYSSAVLAADRNSASIAAPPEALVAQQHAFNRLSQHEQELANLRGRPVAGEVAPATITPRVTTKLPATTTTQYKLVTSAPHCSRYQFSCHSGECIAVYNACDGIPQCADGSDEAAELNCPEPGPALPAMVTPSSMQLGRVQISNDEMAVSSHARKQLQQIQPQPPSQPRKIVAVENQQNAGAPPNRAYGQLEGTSLMSEPKQISDPMRPHQTWIPHQSNEQYEADSHIFNHKGGLQLSGGQYVDGPAVDMSRAGDTYRQPGEVYRSRQPPVWQPDHAKPLPETQDWSRQPPSQIITPIRQFPQNEPPQWQQQDWAPPSVNQWAVGQPQQEPVPPRDPVVIPPRPAPIQQTNPIPPASVADANHAVKAASTKQPETDEYSDESYEETTAPPIKENANRKGKGKHKHQHKMAHAEKSEVPLHEQLKMAKEMDEKDGPAERPGGAVLSLTLGVCITAALAVLAGCRLRAVRRRIRRPGKSSHAHDADYLVNGMYL